MEFSAGGADALGEGGLDVHVDVFEFDGEFEVSGGDFLFDFAEAGLDLLEFILGEEAGFYLGTSVGDGARDIVRVKSPVV